MNALTATTPPETAWNLGSAPTEELALHLRSFGIDAEREAVRRDAIRSGSPSALADAWLERVRHGTGAIENEAEPELVSMLTEIAFELWRRWLSDLSCAEVLADEFDREYEPLDTLMFGNPFLVREAIHRAYRIVNACAPPGSDVNRALFEEIWSHTWHDLALWLRCLPQILAHRGLLNDAVDLCERLAPIFDARAFLADRAILLAQAGRGAEAVGQVSANVKAWPRDPQVLRKSCETLWALGRAEEAMSLYDDVIEILEPSGGAGADDAPREPAA